MTYYDREDQFLRQRLQKEIPSERSKSAGDIWI